MRGPASILEITIRCCGMPPASVMKAVTAQYALEALGPTHAFRHPGMAQGTVINGRVEGDIMLVGGGDPVLNTDGLAELAAALKSAGLREVTGRFLVHDGVLPRIDTIDPNQPDHLGYNPAVSGLNLNFNRVHFEWKTGGRKLFGRDGCPVREVPPRYPDGADAAYRIARRRFYTYDSQGDVEDWTVARSALGTGGSRWLPVRRPALYAGEVFRPSRGRTASC